ncbi:response regulator transcription factor [Vogesella sp. LIG4]|uniref:response regulator transcription factor n=1 Tax=Vogesella sp. LIG4 TaxID=1192162 RepID=UPI00081FF7D8|nr:helix-turn-helix transcriptional regulator [Vogesella sp. LIG4]SCK29421.1 Response regulator containing a CheY-like receiver domain and an HTH DNA-binding domain [Vogesella sp. LIG4]
MQLNVADLAFHQRLGRLVDSLDNESFWQHLAAFLREQLVFDTWVAVLFRPGVPPLVLADSAVNYANDDLFADYMRGLYLLDPFYAFALKCAQPGVYRLDEVAPDSFRDTEYFKHYFSRNVVTDEVQFLLPMASGTLSLSLGSKRRFSDTDIGLCCLFAPWLLPLLRQAARLEERLSQPVPPDAAQSRQQLEEALRLRGTPALTNREVEVALLILGGHSTKGVARELDISLETAKVHRRNLYAKLGVSSQAALFLLFAEMK